MIKLRLRRMGAKKRPSYRIVVADSRSPRDGRFIEAVGFYDPLTEPATVKMNEERARYWLSVGAQPTNTVRHLLIRHGVIGPSPAAPNGEHEQPAATEGAAPVETDGEQPADA